MFLVLSGGLLTFGMRAVRASTASGSPPERNVQIFLRDFPDTVRPGARVEIVVDFRNDGSNLVTNGNATLDLPAGAALYSVYPWNTPTQAVNTIGGMLPYMQKTLPSNPPRFYAVGSDDFNDTEQKMIEHFKPFDDLHLRISANILGGALYYDIWDPENTFMKGLSLLEYMKYRNDELAYHSFHHPHMGLCLHVNSKWIGEQYRRYKRGTRWGIPNTATEEKIEILLGKYWNEVYFDRRMEGYRSPFLEFNIPEGQETKTKTPLRALCWGILGKSGLRYVCTVNEGPSGWPPEEIGKTPQASLDPRTAVPSWVPMCDEITVAGNVTDPYVNYSHRVHNLLVGTQRLNISGTWTWGTIYDDSLSENFDYATSMDFLKKYTKRHFEVVQDEVPFPYLFGVSGPNMVHKNVPLSFGCHAFVTCAEVPDLWAAENKKGYDWVYDIHDYITQHYPDAHNVTHKEIVDYYLGQATLRWVVEMPQTPDTYTFTVQTNMGASKTFQIEVKAPETLYAAVPFKGVQVDSAADVAGKAALGYTDVVYEVKGPDGVDHSGSDLDAVIAAAQSEGLGVYARIDVFMDEGMHTTQTLDYEGNVIPDIAEPVDQTYRNKLKSIVSTVCGKNVKGVIMDTVIPTWGDDGPTAGYSTAMVNHFRKYFGPPPAGGNSQDPTSDYDPQYWSIYSAAATDDWRWSDIQWLYYDIKKLAYEFFSTGDMSNLPPDSNGVRVVNWLLCTDPGCTDDTGVSSWDEWEAWGEFRKYMIADFVNEIASAKGSKKVYAMVSGEPDVFRLQKNTFFGDGSDPIEFADITRRPNILPDMWNFTKNDDIDGIFYYVETYSEDHVKKCADVARRVDYWVAKGGNTNKGIMPANEFRPMNDTKIYGIFLDTDFTSAEQVEQMKKAAATVNGTLPFGVVVCGTPHTLFTDTDEISEATGGTANLTLAAGSTNANRKYLLLGSMSGTEPGIPLPGGNAVLPLNWDLFTNVVLSMLNTSVFTDFMGYLDGSGSGMAQLNLPPLGSGYAGLKMYFAYCLNGPYDFASNPVTIEIVP